MTHSHSRTVKHSLLPLAVAITLAGCATSKGVHWRYVPEPAGPQTAPWHPTEVPAAEPIAPPSAPEQASSDASSAPADSSPSEVPEPRPAEAPWTPYQTKDGSDQGAGRAVIALRTSAERARASGDYAQAISALERALRIDSRNPNVWSDLAQVYLDQKMYEQAENMAQKSISLSGGSLELEARNQQMISIIRQARGGVAPLPSTQGSATGVMKAADGG